MVRGVMPKVSWSEKCPSIIGCKRGVRGTMRRLVLLP